MACGRQASFLVTRTSSDHMISLLSSADNDAASVKLPALVKTSDQPSFSSANFSPFTSTEALRSSDINPVPSLNLRPNPRGGTAKKMSSPYKTLVEATPKKKIKRATESKTSRLASNIRLGPSKDGREGFSGIQLRLTLHQIRTLT